MSRLKSFFVAIRNLFIKPQKKLPENDEIDVAIINIMRYFDEISVVLAVPNSTKAFTSASFRLRRDRKTYEGGFGPIGHVNSLILDYTEGCNVLTMNEYYAYAKFHDFAIKWCKGVSLEMRMQVHAILSHAKEEMLESGRKKFEQKENDVTEAETRLCTYLEAQYKGGGE